MYKITLLLIPTLFTTSTIPTDISPDNTDSKFSLIEDHRIMVDNMIMMERMIKDKKIEAARNITITDPITVTALQEYSNLSRIVEKEHADFKALWKLIELNRTSPSCHRKVQLFLSSAKCNRSRRANLRSHIGSRLITQKNNVIERLNQQGIDEFAIKCILTQANQGLPVLNVKKCVRLYQKKYPPFAIYD